MAGKAMRFFALLRMTAPYRKARAFRKAGKAMRFFALLRMTAP